MDSQESHLGFGSGVQIIADYAHAECRMLTGEVIFPGSVDVIGKLLFSINEKRSLSLPLFSVFL